MTKPIPEGLHAITPHLCVNGAAKAIDFYKRAFGAKEISRSPGPNDTIMHAEIQIGDSRLFLADEFPGMGGPKPPTALGSTTVLLNLYVADADRTFSDAVAAGAKVQMAIGDQFWGDRYGQVTDPFGHAWAIATRKEDLTPAEIQKRAAAFFAKMTPA